MMILPHEPNNGLITGKHFTIGKNAFSTSAFPVISRRFVWQRTEHCVFRAWFRLGPRIFYFPKKRGENKK